MKSKDEYIDSMSAKLKEWSVQIDHLNAKAETATDQGKEKYAREIEGLRARQHRASEQLQAMRAASGDAWESVKESSEKVWDDLRSGLSDAMAKFK